MQLISSRPLTTVAQAVTDRLHNEDEISKGGPVVNTSNKTSPEATRGRSRPGKTSSVNSSIV